MQSDSNFLLSPSKLEWALLLLALVVAAILRFWQLDQFPPGLYRDEAFNGLDALKVLEGDLALFFPANNGREPLYIYLTTLAVTLWGRTSFAVRFAAAFTGTLTTATFFLLAKSWFGWRTGVLAAWIWAITFWPVHISRVGLRTVLVVPLIVLTFWLTTLAYRRGENWLWGLAGLVYGAGFYTYLAFRFTPALLLLFGLFLLISGRGRRLWPSVLWFGGGLLICVAPIAYLSWQQPDILFGRSGQVSILNPDVYGDSVPAALGRNIWAALNMFLWRGDDILRHNVPGRPVFDPLLAIPFLFGLVWCVRNWRRPQAVALILWLVVLLGPTILAADAPHFLRGIGVLPAAVLLAAIGLAWIWRLPRFPEHAGDVIVAALILGSLLWTVTDYRTYMREPQVAFAFEAATTELASELNAEPEQIAIYLDERLWASWPSLPFLVVDDARIERFWSPDELPDMIAAPAVLYTWPYESLDYLPELLEPPLLVGTAEGPLTRGDFEQSPYPLYARYEIDSLPTGSQDPQANFADQVYLYRVNVDNVDPNTLQVDIYWGAESVVDDGLVSFVHVSGPEGLIGQDDRAFVNGRWSGTWWRPDLQVRDSHTITLDEPFDSSRHLIELGLYLARDGQRLPVSDVSNDQDVGTTWPVTGE